MASPVVAPSVVKAPMIAAPVIKPTTKVEVPQPKLEIEQKPDEPEISVGEEIVSQKLEPVSDIVAGELEPEVATEEIVKTVQDEVEKVQKMTVLKPIKKLESVEAVKTTVLKPITTEVPSSKSGRGAPPSSAPGVKPGSQTNIKQMTTLRPLTKLIPIGSKNTDSTKEVK